GRRRRVESLFVVCSASPHPGAERLGEATLRSRRSPAPRSRASPPGWPPAGGLSAADPRPQTAVACRKSKRRKAVTPCDAILGVFLKFYKAVRTGVAAADGGGAECRGASVRDGAAAGSGGWHPPAGRHTGLSEQTETRCRESPGR